MGLVGTKSMKDVFTVVVLVETVRMSSDVRQLFCLQGSIKDEGASQADSAIRAPCPLEITFRSKKMLDKKSF